jgi:Tfp pilus assembly protein PilO
MIGKDAKPWQTHAAGTALALGLAAGAYLLQIGPALSRHEQTEARAVELSADQSKLRELERTLRGLKEHASVVEREASKAELKLLPATQLNTQLARLTELAAGNSLRVDSIESGQTSLFPRYSSIAVRISGQGNYRSCAGMLKQIHSTMPDMAVVAIEMGSLSVTSDTTVTFAFDLLWYTQPQTPAK